MQSLENLNEWVANLFLNFDIDFDKAMRMRKSDLNTIFESKHFTEWKKSREAKGKMDLAVCDRLDNVIRAIGGLGKVLASRRI